LSGPAACNAAARQPPRPGDALWMQRALEQARAAATVDEVPVGAVLTVRGRLVVEGHNRTRVERDPTLHAEMVVLRRAFARLGVDRLPDATLYVTLEPCAMCAGALVLAKLGRLVFAAHDPKSGMCGSLADLVNDPRLNHRVPTTAGVLEAEAAAVLRGFFRSRR
jgi:tRNA(adenine34) deaminase